MTTTDFQVVSGVLEYQFSGAALRLDDLGITDQPLRGRVLALCAADEDAEEDLVLRTDVDLDKAALPEDQALLRGALKAVLMFQEELANQQDLNMESKNKLTYACFEAVLRSLETQFEIIPDQLEEGQPTHNQGT